MARVHAPGPDGIDLADLDHFQRGIPHQSFARLRRDAPVVRNPGANGGFWSLLLHADVSAVNRDSRRFSSERRGVMLFDQDFIDDFCGLGGVADGIPDLFSLRLVALVHELGHVFNTAHEKTTGSVHPVIDPGGFDTCNAYNLMVGGGYCIVASLFAKELTGTGNADRRFGATAPIAGPRYSVETVAQFNFASLLSVEAANNLVPLVVYV